VVPVRAKRALAIDSVVVALGTAGQAAAGYKVSRGDTLTRIARKTGVPVDRLVALNGIRDAHRIRVGQELRLDDGPVLRTQPATPKPPRKVSSKLPAKLRSSPPRLDLMGHFDEQAAAFGVPADLLKATAWQESGWQNDKVSSTKAVGVGQLMPATVAFVNDILLRARLDPGKPDENIRMSARFLRYLLDQNGGDVPRALASYYQGLASTRREGPKASTKAYVKSVLALRPRFA
jgi:murein DD-endopeptidase MepM/ murein hydrolase activator NlpD